jgi:hypothetical protein
LTKQPQSPFLVRPPAHDGSYLDHVTTKRAERLEDMGRVQVLGTSKGAVNHAILSGGNTTAQPVCLQEFNPSLP